jgi:coenzyme F420-reducing hydrogenase beta subunit
VGYLKNHREKRVILVGTSCAVRGLLAAFQRLNLKRENYLLVGLFCDKVFNYNVIAYWQDRYCQGSALTALHFKNKESGGWPGDMKFFPEGQDPFYVPLSDRAKAKAYFMPERCLYCVDKLNACADISLGDNYTGKDESALGSNSVIIRTERGAAAWSTAEEQLQILPIDIADIQKAQAIDLRLDNLYFGDLRAAQLGKDSDWNRGVPREKELADFGVAWKKALEKLRAGAVYDAEPTVLKKQIKKDNKRPNILLRILRRCCRIVKRAMM